MSLLTDLFSTLDSSNLGIVGGALGESGQSVSRGLQSAIAAVLGGMASKSDNPNFLQKMLDLAPTGPAGVSWSNLSSSVADPNSPLMSTGSRIVSTLFGDGEGPVTRALGTGTGLQTGVISSLMTMAAPMVMSFLGNRVRDQGMSMRGLGSLLKLETPSLRAALPAGVTDLLWPRGHEALTAPVMAQTAARERPSRSWLPALLLVALVPALVWMFSHARVPFVPTPPAATGSANRTLNEIPEISKPNLPKKTDLYFEKGSMKLLPESEAQLKQFASALTTNHGVHVMVNGYTDNMGNAASNLQLSQERANAVKADLVRMGISENRVSAQGFGEQSPIANNATPEGRGMNRRVSVEVGNR